MEKENRSVVAWDTGRGVTKSSSTRNSVGG